MADSALIHWLVEHKQELSLEVTQLDWPARWFDFEFYDAEMSIIYNRRRFVGRGSASDEELCFTKAASELVERLACRNHNVSSIGAAAFADESNAKERAENELWERTTFASYLICGLRFRKLEASKYFLTKFEKAIAKLRGQRATLRFFHLSDAPEHTVFCAVDWLASPNRKGAVVGLARHLNLDIAAENSFYEAMRNVSALDVDSSAVEPLTLTQFSRISRPTSSDRQALTYEPEFWNSIVANFEGGVKSPLLQLNREVGIKFEHLPIELARKVPPVQIWRASFLDSIRPSIEFGKSVIPADVFLDNIPRAGFSVPNFLG